MTPEISLPGSVETWADVLHIADAARTAETPCGDAGMVWRIWGDGEPLILLHGGSGGWNHWVRNIVRLVNAGRKVIVPDLPGFGDSAPPPLGHDADAMPEWIEKGLQQLLGPLACDIVAFSFGSMVAALLAADRPDRVRRLVLAGAPALATLKAQSLGLRAWSHKPVGPERDAVLRHNLGRIMLARPESIDALALALHTDNVEREHERMKRRRLSSTDLILKLLPRIQCPVSGIWGTEDALYRGRLETIGPALAHAPDLRSVQFIDGAGHWVQYENSNAFDDFLAAALAEPLVR